MSASSSRAARRMAGIQSFQSVTEDLDSGFHRSDAFLRDRQIPLEAFEKLEEILENYALVQLMKKNEDEEALGKNEAKTYYNQLEKAQ